MDTGELGNEWNVIHMLHHQQSLFSMSLLLNLLPSTVSCLYQKLYGQQDQDSNCRPVLHTVRP